MKKDNIKFSIITTTFNSERDVKKLLESVKNQTYQNFEHIFVDSLSNDNTLKIIKTYKNLYNIKIIEKKCSIYEGFNIGIRESVGDYVNFIGSDDYYENENVLEKIHNYSLSNDKLFYGKIYFINSKTEKKTRQYNSQKMSLNKFRFGFMPAHTSMFFPKKDIIKIGNYNLNYKIASDFDFCLRFFLSNIEHQYLDLLITVNKEGGTSNKNIKNIFKSNIEILKILKLNKIYSNLIFIFFKFLIKISNKLYYLIVNLFKQ